MSTMMSRKAAFAGAVAIGAAVAMGAADAEANVTFSGSGVNPDGGAALSASVAFDVIGANQLKVTLTNTGASATRPSDALLAVFFNLNSSSILTPVSGSMTVGGCVNGNGNPAPACAGATLPVGQGWQYKTTSQYGADRGISAAGLGVFGPNGNFDSVTQNLDGLDYGIVANANTSSGNNPIKSTPLIVSFATFLLNGLPTGYNLNDITDVTFQYGTDLREPHFSGTSTPVPVPAALPIIGAALAGFGFVGWRQQRNPA